jgi:hypothetical protein
LPHYPAGEVCNLGQRSPGLRKHALKSALFIQSLPGPEPLDLSSLSLKLALLSPYLVLRIALRNFIILQFIADQHSGSDAKGSANRRTGTWMTYS